ncbi:MAG: hypothetical protein AAFY78_07415 [Cyanobacteria bacterium J06648_16]
MFSKLVSKPRSQIFWILLIGMSYLLGGSALYIDARFSKALIRTASYYGSDSGAPVVQFHNIEPGEYRLDGLLYFYVLFPFRMSEILYWYITAPVGSPYLPDNERVKVDDDHSIS